MLLIFYYCTLKAQWQWESCSCWKKIIVNSVLSIQFRKRISKPTSKVAISHFTLKKTELISSNGILYTTVIKGGKKILHYVCSSRVLAFNFPHKGYSYAMKQTYFYRSEFQPRGTVYLHTLVWLEGNSIRRNLLRADKPCNDLDLACEVCNLQPSRKGALPKNEPNSVYKHRPAWVP